ncbi:MAG: radical SAM protein [bacterium]
MPKVILINPPFNISKENYDSSVSVGLLSIATYLASKRISVKIIDGARQKNYIDLIEKNISDCEYAGLSVMTTQISNALDICALIRKLNPLCKIILGGGHPTFFVKETIAHPLVDIVCCGEGELAMHEIVCGKELGEIKGIAYKNKGEIIINEPMPLHDPAQMPLFNWELESREILEKLYLIPSLTSRGCPHRCTFCINAILKNRWRPRTAEQVLRDLDHIASKEYFKNKRLRFWDENFFVDINRAKKIIDGMLERNFFMPWETTIRANYIREGMVDGELLEKLRKTGCYLLSFGAESGSPEILKKIKKDITPDEVVNSARQCLKHGIIPQYSFMIGLPGETKADMKMTLKLIDRLTALSDKVQILGPQAFRPYPGSPLYEECVAAGWKAPETLDEWAHLARNELSYLTVQNFPWVKHKNFVESMEAYVRFGAHSVKSAMGSSVKAKKFVKLAFVLICQLRWKLKFFAWPIEFKLAKRFVVK